MFSIQAEEEGKNAKTVQHACFIPSLTYTLDQGHQTHLLLQAKSRLQKASQAIFSFGPSPGSVVSSGSNTASGSKGVNTVTAYPLPLPQLLTCRPIRTPVVKFIGRPYSLAPYPQIPSLSGSPKGCMFDTPAPDSAPYRHTWVKGLLSMPCSLPKPGNVTVTMNQDTPVAAHKTSASGMLKNGLKGHSWISFSTAFMGLAHASGKDMAWA